MLQTNKRVSCSFSLVIDPQRPPVSTIPSSSINDVNESPKTMCFSLCILLICLIPRISAAEVAPITTQGNQVLIGGQEGSLAGNSFFWSNFGGDAYYNAKVVS